MNQCCWRVALLVLSFGLCRRSLLTAQCLVLTSENVIEMQRSQTEEAERQAEVLQDELRRREAEYEQEILQLRQQQTSKLRWGPSLRKPSVRV